MKTIEEMQDATLKFKNELFKRTIEELDPYLTGKIGKLVSINDFFKAFELIYDRFMSEDTEQIPEMLEDNHLIIDFFGQVEEELYTRD